MLGYDFTTPIFLFILLFHFCFHNFQFFLLFSRLCLQDSALPLSVSFVVHFDV